MTVTDKPDLLLKTMIYSVFEIHARKKSHKIVEKMNTKTVLAS